MINSIMNIKCRNIVSKNVELIGSGEIDNNKTSDIRNFTVIEMLNGKLVIGDKSVIGYHNVLQCSGTIIIGFGTLIGPHCCIIASEHLINNIPLIDQPLKRSKVVIGDNVWIGANCTINAGITIGNNAVIGANSFVNADVPNDTIYVGSPAKYLRDRI